MTPDKALVNTLIYVAESDEQAEREAIPHIEKFFTVFARTTPRYLNPPGYVSLDQFKIRAGAANAAHGGFDWKGLTENWRVAVGTPSKVVDLVGQWCEEADSSRVIMWSHLGDMPHWKVVKNLTLMAEEVIPKLRPRRPAAGRSTNVLAGAK
jgi:alkanesulfonate monooxygenase SsuD/methylene tetrahydromethanopterin reductase-like flavin-dependent oxidoreductase (luciferase family)